MSRLLKITLILLVMLAAAAPAGAAAMEIWLPGTTSTGETTTTPPAETTPAPAETPPPSTTPSTSTPATTTPAPAETTPPPTTPPATTAPQVSSQHAQGRSSSPTQRESAAESNAAAEGGKGKQGAKGKGAGGTKVKRGKRAPKPSALTPPLPLSLSSSIAGVPGFFIESFRIPPFLLPIFQAAGSAYGVPWQVLAAINEVETDYGRDLSVSSAGAEGWMQFLPSSWETYGVDANGDGFKDPYNPADAIFAAARYLRAAGAAKDVRGAIFSYNHSQAYVESVMLRAKLLGGTPDQLLGAITGLTEARFPVHAKSHFSDGFLPATSGSGGAEVAGTTIYSEAGAPVIAVQDGQIVQIGDSPTLGRFVSLRDAYGNTYTYAKLGSIAELYPVLKPHDGTGAKPAPAEGADEPKPTAPASAGTHAEAAPPTSEDAGLSALSPGSPSGLESGSSPAAATSAPAAAAAAAGVGAESPAAPAGGEGSAETAPAQASPQAAPATGETGSATPREFRAGPDDVYLHELHEGVRVIAGTVLGHVAQDGEGAGEPHMFFQIRPAGVGAPMIDPKPILDGWVQLENTSIFRAKGQAPFQSSEPSPGQVLLESKEQLQQQVLANPGIDIYPCGRQDIQTGQIDRRVLATLEFLEVSGLKPTVSALKCGHSELTAEGNVSEHSTGDAVDISAVNGTPIVGHQGPGTITDTTIRKLLTLQGSMKPHQIISLMSYPGTDNTLAKADHYNHIHVGFRPYAQASLAGSLTSSITPGQWIKLIARLGEIPDPTVANGPSSAAIPVHPHDAQGGEG
ncbi:MAG TPA: lytic murein transglycosylase [Solirubrobacteraceae bacterium]|nr:lytic murein transglycosylase [Solirubrobacteraceae bacterium]